MNECSMQFDEWFNMNSSAIKTAQDHPQLRQILQKNLELKNLSHDNLDKVFTGAALNMKNLNTLIVGSLKILVEVLSLVLEIKGMALRQISKSYTTFAKIPLWMMKTNIQLLRDSHDVVTMTISSFCSDFYWLKQQLLSSPDNSFISTYLLIARIPVTLLAETQKMFPENLGTPAILKTSIAIQDLGQEKDLPMVKELDSKFFDIVVDQRTTANFYADFFKPFDDLSDKQLQLVLSFCNGVTEDIPNDDNLLVTAMQKNERSNFCLLLIQFLAENPHSIHLCPELYHQLLLQIVALILTENLSPLHFQFIEKALVVKICSDDYWHSLICYQIFQEMLIQLRSSSAIAKYDLFFRQLFASLPGRSICSVPKLLIMSLLKLILHDLQEPGTRKEKFIDLDFIYIPGCDFQGRFNANFRKLNDDPKTESYYKLVGCLKSLRAGEIDDVPLDTSENFLKLIKMTGGVDFDLYNRVISSILDVMRSATNEEFKMICMVKLSSVLSGVDKKPWEIELKLLSMLFSYIPLAKVKMGLPQILIKEFSKLLCDSANKVALIRIVQKTMAENLGDWSSGSPSPQHVELIKFLNSFSKAISQRSVVQTLLESKRLKRLHKCIETKHIAEPIEVPSEDAMETLDSSSDLELIEPPLPSNPQLQSILEYSKSLENRTLNEADLEIISEIVETLCNLAPTTSQ